MGSLRNTRVFLYLCPLCKVVYCFRYSAENEHQGTIGLVLTYETTLAGPWEPRFWLTIIQDMLSSAPMSESRFSFSITRIPIHGARQSQSINIPWSQKSVTGKKLSNDWFLWLLLSFVTEQWGLRVHHDSIKNHRNQVPAPGASWCLMPTEVTSLFSSFF